MKISFNNHHKEDVNKFVIWIRLYTATKSTDRGLMTVSMIGFLY